MLPKSGEGLRCRGRGLPNKRAWARLLHRRCNPRGARSIKMAAAGQGTRNCCTLPAASNFLCACLVVFADAISRPAVLALAAVRISLVDTEPAVVVGLRVGFATGSIRRRLAPARRLCSGTPFLPPSFRTGANSGVVANALAEF